MTFVRAMRRLKDFPWIRACGRTALSAVLLSALSACAFVRSPSTYFPDRGSIPVGGTVVVKDEANAYALAQAYNVSMRDLIVLNELPAPYNLKPGQTLTLPAGGMGPAGEAFPPLASPMEPVQKTALAPIVPPGVSSQSLEPLAPPPPPSPAEPEKIVPSVEPPQVLQPLVRQETQKQVVATTAAAPAALERSSVSEGSVLMKWPVQGPILSTVGAKSSGLNNDGVNIGAPKGSPVVAAASGTVVYAGDDMKGFGHLVLIRHEGDLVTAYAHLDRVLVKKDSVLRQGDMIGTVGKTGNVSSPQLHFEIREGGKPVNPSKRIDSDL